MSKHRSKSLAHLLNQDHLIERAQYHLHALLHPSRAQLLAIIHEHKRINVSNLYTLANLEQSLVSQHLKVLRDTNLVSTKRTGQFIFYRINYPVLQQYANALQHLS